MERSSNDNDTKERAFKKSFNACVLVYVDNEITIYTDTQ